MIADLAVNYVERQVLLAGYSLERIVHDYGIDLLIVTYSDGGDVEPGTIPFQVKATDALTAVAGGSALSFTVSTADLGLWLTELMPVILVLYGAAGDQAFWLYIQRYAEENHLRVEDLGASVALRIPTGNLLNPESVKLFREFKSRVWKQIGGPVRHSGA